MFIIHVSNWVDQCRTRLSVDMSVRCKLNDCIHADVSHQASSHVVKATVGRMGAHMVANAVRNKCKRRRSV